MIPRVFSIDIPEALHKEALLCKDDATLRTLGERWCVEQSKDLIKRGAPCLHYYTMGRVDGFVRIAREVL